MDKKDISDYRSAGCQFFHESPTIFYALLPRVSGNACETGCGYFRGGKCPAYMKLSTPSKIKAGQLPQETVKETARRLGISISEVRRRRRQA